MAQSFWTHPEYQRFKKYTDKLSDTYKSMSEMDLKTSVENWQRGAEKMQQIAIGYDVEYTPPTPEFLSYSKKDEITWIKFNKLDGYTIGLWDGPNTVIDGKPVFHPNYLDIAIEDQRSITEMSFTEARLAMFEVFKTFDGVAIPKNVEVPF